MSFWPKDVPDYQWPDSYLAPALAPFRWMMTALFQSAYLVGRVLRPLQRKLPPVLVVRTDGLGDALLFEPAIESLARVVSPREIHFWGPKLACEMLKDCPSISRRVSIPRGFKAGNLHYFRSPFWRTKMGLLIGLSDYECVVYPAESPEPLGNWIFSSVQAVERWLNSGNTDNQYEWQRKQSFTTATRVLEPRPGSAHESIRNDYLAGQWDEGLPLRQPRVYLPDRTAARAAKIVRRWRIKARQIGGERLIGVMPAGSSSVNRYPAAKWATALTRLWNEQEAVAVILGGPKDFKLMRELSDELGDTPHFLLGKSTGILRLSGIVKRLDGLLTVDTGLAHISVAQSVPTVVVSAGGSPGRFFPWPHAKHHITLNHSMPCEGCRNRCHLAEAECVTRVTPDDLVRAMSKLIKNREDEKQSDATGAPMIPTYAHTRAERRRDAV